MHSFDINTLTLDLIPYITACLPHCVCLHGMYSFKFVIYHVSNSATVVFLVLPYIVCYVVQYVCIRGEEIANITILE